MVNLWFISNQKIAAYIMAMAKHLKASEIIFSILGNKNENI